MPVYSGIGVYSAYAEDDAHEGDEVSSTYEGRHLTFLGSELIGPHALIEKGDPVVVKSGNGDIVGVAFKTQVLAGDKIAIDTEGIWMLEVVAKDDYGNDEVEAGDPLFINTTDLSCVISKIQDPESNTLFGYALGNIDAGETAVIAVKVHWGPSLDHIWMGIATPYLEAGTEARIRIIEQCSLVNMGHFGSDFQLVLTAVSTTGSFYAKRGMVTISAVTTQTDGETVGVDGAVSLLGRLNGGGLGGVRLAGIKGTIVSSGDSDVITACDWIGAVVGACMLDTAVIAGMYAAFVGYSAGGAGACIPHAVLYAYGTYRNGIDLSGWVGIPEGNHALVLDGNRGYTPNTNDLSADTLIAVIRVEINEITGYVPVLAAAP